MSSAGNTIQTLDNVGGNGFPFADHKGAPSPSVASGRWRNACSAMASPLSARAATKRSTSASRVAGQPVWYRIVTDISGYRCRNAVEAYGLRIVGDTQSGTFGYLTDVDRRHFGIEPIWQFEAGLLYNQGVGAIVHSIELIGLPGRGGVGAVFMSTTRDGETWGAERAVRLIPANRSRRLAWRPHCRIGNYLGLRFRGAGTALPGIAAIEAKLAPLTS
jgi:hypothetical protein